MSCGLRNKIRPLAADQSVGCTVQSDGKEMAEPPHRFLPNPNQKPKVTKPNGIRGQEDKVNEGGGSRVRNMQHHLIPLLIRNGYKEALLSVKSRQESKCDDTCPPTDGLPRVGRPQAVVGTVRN